MNDIEIDSLRWDKGNGLLPAIVQDPSSQQILMLGYMNASSLKQTIASGKVTFFSRSRNRIWVKGETSGHELHVERIEADCDQDTLLVLARPLGPTCHRGTISCFDGDSDFDLAFLANLGSLINDRFQKRPEGSYTTKLFEAGLDRMAQKLGEEAIETVIASKNSDESALINESADLLYHLMVLLRARDLSLSDVVTCLRQRHAGPPA